jgi:hypothetical protein
MMINREFTSSRPPDVRIRYGLRPYRACCTFFLIVQTSPNITELFLGRLPVPTDIVKFA